MAIETPGSNEVDDPSDFFATIYCILFGLLLLAFEVKDWLPPRIRKPLEISVRSRRMSRTIRPFPPSLKHCTLVPQIRHNFGFMYKEWGRALYLGLIGTLPLGLGTMGQVVGILMLLNALANFVVLCKFPQQKPRH
jgi:hypothetical protein